MDLTSEQGVRAFLRLCIAPPGREGRTFENLARILPDWITEAFTEHAPPLAVLRDAVHKADANAAAARARYAAGLRDWTLADPASDAPDPLLCPQNLVGSKRVPGEHHYEPGMDGCVFCGPGASYAFNRHSVNRKTKHAHRDGRTRCDRQFEVTEPLDAERAAGLALCGGCRLALTNDTKENDR
ncbi:hypothetical protein ACFY0G_17385 [Streptomyces sp. NPDC001552]|uniref:hypothetical protein n=1 Tax=Streptomyces sp. NPDC001552 TaxID=3364587 RepID=UPI0036C46085